MDFIELVDKNWEVLRVQDKKAKDAGTLKGRFIQEQYADGYAIYEITKVNKKTVRIRVVTDIGDDWRIPYWGDETSIDIAYAIQNIGHRDRLDAIFS